MFLSLIIPVYNVEKYLDNCIKSVIMHRPEVLDMEVILIDDGSTDQSGKICDRYASSYGYIKVIHKENGGLSSARNEGIYHAEGIYIMFMDSDDWWNPDVSLQKMITFVKAHERTEMFLFTSYDYVENKGYFQRNEHKHLSGINTIDVKQFYQSLLDNGNLEIAAYTKILKKSFIVDNRLFFKEGMLSEDNEWIIRLLRRLKDVEIIDEPLYIYRLFREDSIANNIKQKNIDDLLKIVRSSQLYYKKSDSQDLKKLELCYVSYLWFSALGLSTLLSIKEQKLLRNSFSRTAAVCRYSNSPKTKLCYFIYNTLGLTVTARILGAYIRFKKGRTFNRTKVPNISEVKVL